MLALCLTMGFTASARAQQAGLHELAKCMSMPWAESGAAAVRADVVERATVALALGLKDPDLRKTRTEFLSVLAGYYVAAALAEAGPDPGAVTVKGVVGVFVADVYEDERAKAQALGELIGGWAGAVAVQEMANRVIREATELHCRLWLELQKQIAAGAGPVAKGRLVALSVVPGRGLQLENSSGRKLSNLLLRVESEIAGGAYRGLPYFVFLDALGDGESVGLAAATVADLPQPGLIPARGVTLSVWADQLSRPNAEAHMPQSFASRKGGEGFALLDGPPAPIHLEAELADKLVTARCEFRQSEVGEILGRLEKEKLLRKSTSRVRSASYKKKERLLPILPIFLRAERLGRGGKEKSPKKAINEFERFKELLVRVDHGVRGGRLALKQMARIVSATSPKQARQALVKRVELNVGHLQEFGAIFNMASAKGLKHTLRSEEDMLKAARNDHNDLVDQLAHLRKILGKPGIGGKGRIRKRIRNLEQEQIPAARAKIEVRKGRIALNKQAIKDHQSQ